jgi:integrase
VCGYYRFAHIDGRITSNPAQYVRRSHVHPPAQRGMDRGELASFLYTAERTSPMHAALAVLLGLNGLRVSEACGTSIEELGFERGVTASCASSAKETSQPASARTPHRSHRPPADRRTQPRTDLAAPQR